jgi:hypothetical protein
VRSIIDGFIDLYRALEGEGSVDTVFQLTPAPVERLSDHGFEPSEEDVEVVLGGAWAELHALIGEGTIDSEALRKKIDLTLVKTLNMTAA